MFSVVSKIVQERIDTYYTTKRLLMC